MEPRHPAGEQRPFSCDKCPAKFKTLNHLRSHVIIHTGNKKFICKFCPKGFIAQHQLNIHTRVNHSDVRKYACNYCNLKFKALSVLSRHCLRDHGETAIYPCKECLEKFETLNELKYHCKNLHGISMNPQKYHGFQDNMQV